MTAPSVVTLDLYDSTNTTLVAHLTAAEEIRWMDPLNDTGSGSFRIAAVEAEACSLITGGNPVYGNVVRCLIDGEVRFAWIVEGNEATTASEGEEGDATQEISGSGTAGYLEDAVMYPERGIGTFSPDTRLFNFASRYFDSSSWVPATELVRYDQTIIGNSWTGIFGHFPVNFPDPLAWWMWGASGETLSDAPDGDVYFRKTFTLAESTACVAVFTCDSQCDIYVDGAMVVSKSGLSGAWTSAGRFDIVLDAGEHVIAIKGRNASLEEMGVGPVLNIGGVLFTLVQNTFGGGENGSDFGAVVLHSDSSWECLEYPAETPGMCPGEVLRILIEEAQLRGSIPALSFTFTDSEDSDGAPWEVCPDFGFQVGATYLATLLQMAEVAFDFHMDPSSMQLDVVNRRGTASGVDLEVGVNVTNAKHSGSGDVVNAILQRYSSGWQEVLSAESIVSGGRKEAFLSVGSAPSDTIAAMAAQAVFDARAVAPDAVAVTHEGKPVEGAQPYVDYDVGDAVTYPDRGGAPVPDGRVRAITVATDANGWPIYTPEVSSLQSEMEDRIQRWIKRMSMGSVGGTSENASPYGAVPRHAANLTLPAAIPGSAPVSCARVRGSGTSFGTSTETTVKYNKLDYECESIDADRLAGTLTIAAAGIWHVEGMIKFEDGAAGRRLLTLKQTQLSVTYDVDMDERVKNTTDEDVTLRISGDFYALDGDVFKLTVFQTSGSTLSGTDVRISHLSAFKVADCVGTKLCIGSSCP